MRELDSLEVIEVYNPLEEDFMIRFNGEPYTIPAESKKAWPTFLALHVAKGLSDKLLAVPLAEIKKVAYKEKNTFAPKNAQLMIYDNPQRRISLYKVLRSKEYVQLCMESFPFKAFIGNVSEYDDYVAKAESNSADTPEEKPSKKKKSEE